MKIGSNILIQLDNSYVVPSIQTGTKDIFFGRFWDENDGKTYIGSIISDKKAGASTFVYFKAGK